MKIPLTQNVFLVHIYWLIVTCSHNKLLSQGLHCLFSYKFRVKFRIRKFNKSSVKCIYLLKYIFKDFHETLKCQQISFPSTSGMHKTKRLDFLPQPQKFSPCLKKRQGAVGSKRHLLDSLSLF